MTTNEVSTEVEMFAIKIPPYFVPKAAIIVVACDGLIHVLQGLGMFATMPTTQVAVEYQVAAQAAQAAAFSWGMIAWGLLLVAIAVMGWVYIAKRSKANAKT